MIKSQAEQKRQHFIDDAFTLERSLQVTGDLAPATMAQEALVTQVH